MTSNSKLRREEDGKIFHVTLLSHWSDIASEDGETDCVKWYGVASSGRMGYISNNKGFSYELLDGTGEESK